MQQSPCESVLAWLACIVLNQTAIKTALGRAAPLDSRQSLRGAVAAVNIV